MSYSYGHGEYHVPSPSTPHDPQFPQWESLEQQQQQQQQRPQLQQQNQPESESVQPVQHPFFTHADDHFTIAQRSPTDLHLPLSNNPHRHSFDDGYSSTSPGEVSTATVSTAPVKRTSRGSTALRRSHARAIVNPYPSSGMHAMQPPAPPSGPEHRVGDSRRFIHQNQHQNQQHSPTASSPPTLGSPMVTTLGSTFGEMPMRTSPYTPPAGNMFPPPTPPATAAVSNAQTPPQAQAQTSPQVPAKTQIRTSCSQQQQRSQRRLTPRADFHYDETTRVLSVAMELPGVKKTQLCITLATCLFNRARQVIVKGTMIPVFGVMGGRSVEKARGGAGEEGVVEEEDQIDIGVGLGVGATAAAAAGSPDAAAAADAASADGGGVGGGTASQFRRERKYGDFSRVLNVPSETRKEDIQAEMEDGVLMLKISCGPPAEASDTQVIPIH